MLSKAKVKYIHSLELKKFRNEYNAFVAEGEKNVSELLPAFECELLVATTEWIQEHPGIHAKEVLAAETEEKHRIRANNDSNILFAIFSYFLFAFSFNVYSLILLVKCSMWILLEFKNRKIGTIYVLNSVN